MTKLKRTSYFYKSLFSYFIILTIPILIFVSIFQLKYTQVLQDELIKNNHNKLNILETSIENEVLQIQEIVKQFIVANDTTPFTLEENQLRAFNLIDKLNQYNSTNTFTSDILYYFHNHKYIYTSSSSHKFTNFINTIYDYKDWELEQFNIDLTRSTSRIIRPRDTITIYNETPRNYTTFIYPISKDGISFYASLIFMVPESEFQDKISQIFADSAVATILLDANKSIITSSNLNEIIGPNNYESFLSQLESENDSIIITANGNDYIMSSALSSISGWQYISFVSIDSALSLVVDIQRQFTVSLILILLIGAFLISILMSMNYSPIKNLQKLSETILNNREKNSNEFDAITGAITYLSKQNSKLNDAVDDSKLASKEYIVGQLLSGQNMTSEYLNQDILIKLFQPEYDNYVSFITYISKNDNNWSILKQALITDIEAYSNKDLYILCKESNIANCIIAVVLFNTIKIDSFNLFIENMNVTLCQKWKIGMTMGVGSSYNTLDSLPKSYMGASTAIDYRLLVGNDTVIYYDHIIHDMKDISDYPYAELKSFKYALKNGQTNEIDSILNNFLKLFAMKTMPLFIARGICYDIITTVVENAKIMGSNHQELFKKYPDIFSITKYESIYKIIEIVKLISYDVCKSLNESYDCDHTILISNMKEYIRDNYMNPDFTLQSMADHYNMRKTNLSTFYKNKTHVNIFEYVTELRMEAAEALLLKSQIPVNQICSQIGYDNVSSFIRRFKQIYGVTPGNYRLEADNQANHKN